MEVLADPSHREVARVAAERSAVLLRNEGSLLPPGAELGSIAVIGPLADSKRDTLGPWVFDYDLDETVTVLEGIQAKVGGSVDVQYAPGVRPAHQALPPCSTCSPTTHQKIRGVRRRGRAAAGGRASSGSDLAVVVVGEWQNMIGESASRSSLELPGRQLELLQAMAQTRTPVVLLVMNGRPLDLRMGRGERAGDPRGLVSGSQEGRPSPTCSSATWLPAEAAVQLASDSRPSADDLQPHHLA